MLHAFIDESHTDKRYYQAALVIKEENPHRLGEAMLKASEYAQGFGISPGVEFHGP